MSERETRPFRQRALGVLAFVFRGLHHVEMRRVKWDDPDHEAYARCEYSTSAELSTFDGAELTALVIAAHDLAVRVSVRPSGRGMVKIVMWPRKRDGAFYEKHPTLEAAAEAWRKHAGCWYDDERAGVRAPPSTAPETAQDGGA